MAGGRTETDKKIYGGRGCASLWGGRTREGWGVRRGTDKMIRFVTFNIRNGRNGGLELALCWMDQVRVDCGVTQETKLINGF